MMAASTMVPPFAAAGCFSPAVQVPAELVFEATRRVRMMKNSPCNERMNEMKKGLRDALVVLGMLMLSGDAVDIMAAVKQKTHKAGFVLLFE